MIHKPSLMSEKNYIFSTFFLLLIGLNVVPAFSQDAVKTIEIKVLPGLQFDLVRFQVQPGTKVKLVFTNTDDMDHNLLITNPGSREEVVKAAMRLTGQGRSKNYIPESPKVLWAIPVVSAEQTKSITFTAPQQEGVYPYVCTYPGHGFVMYGAMYVSASDEMPKLSEDLNIPISRRETKSSNQIGAIGHHSSVKINYLTNPVPPFLYRVYIDGASPAAIAVSLTDSLSYCWDAGVGKLRFAWKGGFVDNTLLWKGHKNAAATIIGTVFYRDQVVYPLRINNREAKVEYKGYRLNNRYPEFHYTVNGLDVYELIKPLEMGNGLVRSFRIPEIKEPLWFVFDENDGIDYQSDLGKQMPGKIQLSAGQAKLFTIIMRAREGSNL